MKLLERLKNRLNKSEVVLDDSEVVLLDREANEFFPKEGKWLYSCYNRPREINKNNLPCHLRDVEWLSKFMQKKLKVKDLNIDLQSIKKYIETSKTFNDLRHNYELEIVRWEIDWIIAGGENWRMPKGYSELDFLFNPDVDKIFRNSVLTTLLSIGMDREVVEEGIEKYSDLWREKYMNLAFYHKYEPVAYLVDPIAPADDNFKQNWLKLRRYEYYTEHKDSVDKYGTLTDDMQLNITELCELIDIVDEQSKQRMKVVEIWKNSPTKNGNLLNK